ncbi:high-temperature-induced dauer-formation protein-domain-containing protein [Naematelia encephala]|uniref:High-temperature-induced dauer-formation protein-domain-containing protein n=1 Tax=Naematelia encephala TaxID=71784 RepID=A0A1Y2AHF5_9TREE|nr:high-temperature-induced dauer-formation protein-domain-containing protein [Naematelia encephala]
MFRRLPTFKSFPQAIGLPFLSTQEDALVKFKSGDNGIKRLYSEEVIPLADVAYWAQWYTIFNSTADVYSLISVQDIRQALTAQPTNLANLILHLSHHLFTLLPSPSFPTSSSSISGQDPTRDALNCLRVLGRILVVVYEAESDMREEGGGEETFGKKWLWSRQPIEAASNGTAANGNTTNGKTSVDLDQEQEQGARESEQQFTIEDDSDEEDDAGVRAFKASVGNPPKQSDAALSNPPPLADPLSENSPAPPAEMEGETEEEENTMPCLVDRLFSCTIDLLFCAGFTVPVSVQSEEEDEKINYVIWEKGVGSTVSVGSSAELDRNKTEVLRFLIVLLSTTIYTPPHALATTPNPPLEQLTHSLERRLVLSLLCSLLNTSLAPARTSSGVTGQLPYNHLISTVADERRTLVRDCLMVLLVALDHSREVDGVMGERDENAFRYFVSKLHRREDFAFILTGITGILEEHVAVQNNYLPGSKKPIPYLLETYMLLWRMVDLNKRFRTYVFESGKITEVVGHVLLTCLELKDDPAHHGLLRMLSYLLQTLSADQGFAEALNQPMRLTIPAKWAVSGSVADFMIVSIYSIATTPGLNPLFPALTISIANVAPFLHNLGVQASTRLLQLFKAFSAPNFLLADEGHPRLVYYLLETFNSILYYQLNENPNLVYAILRSHQDFQTLATFTLVSGLREIQRRKAVRAQETVKKEDAPGIKRTESELEMLAEKAALLGRATDDYELPSSPTQERKQSTDVPTATQPLTSPGDLQNGADPLSHTSTNAEQPEPDHKPQPLSEKARGKMRATESVTSLSSPTSEAEVPDDELMKVAYAGVGPNGYIPTQEWVSSWQKGLPLDPVLVAISELLPKIQDTTPRGGAPSSKVFNVLKGASLVDVLPPPQPVLPRRFQWSPASALWLTSLLWGDIYVAGLTSVGMWRDTTVKLFGVKQAPVKGRTAQVGRVLKMIGVV